MTLILLCLCVRICYELLNSHYKFIHVFVVLVTLNSVQSTGQVLVGHSKLVNGYYTHVVWLPLGFNNSILGGIDSICQEQWNGVS